MAIATLNPTTGEVVKTFEAFSTEEIEQRLVRATSAFGRHRSTPFAQRSQFMLRAAEILDDEEERISALISLEMGKTLKAASAEIKKCAAACRFYASKAERFLSDEPVEGTSVGASKAFARYEPLGPVLAIMPWNFPLWQVMRFAAPALMAGNVGLLKHSSNVPQTAMYLEELFLRAGFEAGVFQTLLIGSDAVEAVLRDPRVKAATLTGSTPAGRSVARTAGEELKTTVLELGGSDPFVVMPSADLEQAVKTAVRSRCQNNGQSCIAAKRFIVHQEVAERFSEKFVSAMSALVVGDPRDEQTDIGPLATESVLTDVEQYVADAVSNGATVLCGGKRVQGPGWFYPPTVVANVTPQMRMYHEEIFGPVAQLHTVASLEEAISLANATPFGLGSNVWTADGSEQERFIEGIEAGAVFVNGMTASFPELPFGGIKDSGYGRELSAHGIRAFCNLKTVWIG